MQSPDNGGNSASGSPSKSRSKANINSRWTEKLFLNFAAAGAFGDERLTPAVFQELAVTFNTTMTELGVISLVGLLASSLTYPISGVVGDAYYRGRIILWSLIGIAATTVMIALSQTYAQLIASKILNGISIGMLVPSLQALMGDMHTAANRGKAFGYLNFTGITGSIVGGTLATILAAGVYWGMDGWRLAFLLWTAYLVVIIIGFVLFAAEGLDEVDYKKGQKLAELADKPLMDQLRQQAGEAWAKVLVILSVPTLQVIIIPQAVGLLPWMAMSGWVTFYLEAMGFTNTATAVMILVTGLGFACGSLLGGVLGDWAESVDRYRGRIALAQITILLGTIVFVFDLQVLPRLLDGTDKLTAGLCYAICLFFTGIVTIGGTGAACNLPIILSCLSASHRTSGVAIERFFGSVMASFAVPLVGVIAQNYFGYHLDEDQIANPSTEAGGDTIFHPYAHRRAVVVGDAITLVAVVCWVFCICIWSILYFTYPADRLSESEEEEEEVLGESAPLYGSSSDNKL